MNVLVHSLRITFQCCSFSEAHRCVFLFFGGEFLLCFRTMQEGSASVMDYSTKIHQPRLKNCFTLFRFGFWEYIFITLWRSYCADTINQIRYSPQGKSQHITFHVPWDLMVTIFCLRKRKDTLNGWGGGGSPRCCVMCRKWTETFKSVAVALQEGTANENEKKKNAVCRKITA